MIQVLSEDTIKKIAAGEVIERPASIVKELVENSIDAQASKIIVEIEQGGKSLIRVVDNGIGIKDSEISLAFLPHSTSKLRNFNDLFVNTSLGFRGEALASVAAVSKVDIQSKTEEEKTGTKCYLVDSKIIKTHPVAMNRGTGIDVRDLFYNVPVRKKFMKKDSTEANFITNLMYRLAIGNPGISFRYIKDKKLIFETKEKESLAKNLINLFGQDYYKEMIFLDIGKNNFKLSGYISSPNYYRANRGMQYLYMNKRYFESQEIREGIEKQYQSIIPNGRFPSYQLFFEMNPALIDVNIHPNKEKIKISLLDDIMDYVSSQVKKLLLNHANIPKHEVRTTTKDAEFFDNPYDNLLKKYSDSFASNLVVKNLGEAKRDENSDANHHSNDHIGDGFAIREATLDFSYSPTETRDSEEFIIDQTSPVFHPSTGKSFEPDLLLTNSQDENKQMHLSSANSKEDLWRDINYIGTLFQTYLLFEKNSNQLLLVDQHAAHERVLFEDFSRGFLSKEIHSQRLVAGQLIDIVELEKNIFLTNKDLFQKLGFDLELFSDRQLILREVPVVYGNPIDKQAIRAIFDELSNEYKNGESMDDFYDLTKDKIIQASCKHAVKSGDQLSDQEIKQLIKDLMACDYPYTCPHGRPTMIEVEKSEIEKMFLRIK